MGKVFASLSCGQTIEPGQGMKKRITNLFVALGLGAGAVLISGEETRAQVLSTLHHFAALDSFFENSDGAYPAAGLVLSGNVLYGTASQGGLAGGGTVFKVNTDGTGFGILHDFTPPNANTGTQGDGAYPFGGLVLAGSVLYGTTSAGGSLNSGTIFKMNVDGSGFATLYTFTAADPNTGANVDGAAPWAGLALSVGQLYGTCTRGGANGVGTIFKVNVDGSGFTTLHSFKALDAGTQTNSDGAFPLGGLTISGSQVYGTAYKGGGLAVGTVFTLNADGTGFAVLNNANGGPRGTLVLSNNVLYGTTENGGSSGNGSLFKLNSNGTGFTNLVSFASDTADGPWAGLILSGNTLYGTTLRGGTAAEGSMFALNTDGTGFTNLYSFSGGADGGQPQAGLVFSGNILYGMASEGGPSGDGTVFSLGLSMAGGRQELTIRVFGGNVVLNWPTNGLKLQATTNLVPPIVWTPVVPGPAVMDCQNAVTNAISGMQRFFGLTQ